MGHCTCSMIANRVGRVERDTLGRLASGDIPTELLTVAAGVGGGRSDRERVLRSLQPNAHRCSRLTASSLARAHCTIAAASAPGTSPFPEKAHGRASKRHAGLPACTLWSTSGGTTCMVPSEYSIRRGAVSSGSAMASISATLFAVVVGWYEHPMCCVWQWCGSEHGGGVTTMHCLSLGWAHLTRISSDCCCLVSTPGTTSPA